LSLISPEDVAEQNGLESSAVLEGRWRNHDGCHAMVKPAQQRIARWAGFGIAVVFLCQGCGAERYHHVVDAAGSGLESLTMADDYRHQRHLQQVLLEEPAFAGLTLTAYVFMDHGYVVGHVNSPEQAEAVFQAAKKVEGLRSINAFLPVKRTVDAVGKVIADSTVKAQIESALARTPGIVESRVHVEVLDNRAILLGIVSGDQEKARAEEAASATIGVKRIINWLLLPESQYLAIRSQVF
jgi:osmotically-inducible protein OsmY